MKKQIITIENGVVFVPQSGDIRMTACEIAALFEVYIQTINANIKAISKSGIIKTEDSLPATVSGKTIIPDLYGLEMITALSFRIQSKNAEVFRNWIMKKVITIPVLMIGGWHNCNISPN